VDVGLQLAKTLYRLYPNDFDPEKMSNLLRHTPTIEAIKGDKSLRQIRENWRGEIDDFLKIRAKYLMY